MKYINFLKDIQKQIFVPINISVLASVGLHAVFFGAMLPKWNLADSKDNYTSLSNTQIVELNPLEATRLPDTSVGRFSNWDVMSQLPSSNNQFSQIPQFPSPDINSFQFPMANTNSLPNLPPPPTGNYSFALPDNNSFRLPPMYSNIPSPSQLPPPPPLSADNSEIANAFPPNPEGKYSDYIPGQQENNNQRESLFPPPDESEIENPRELINSQNNSPEENQNDQIASNSSDNNYGNQQYPVNYSNSTNLVLALQEDGSNTKGEEATKNDIAWRSQAKIAQPKSISISGFYPKDACIRKLSGTAAYGVTVNNQGQVTNAQLLKSSGFPIFNQQGFRQIQYKNFEATGNLQAYHVYVSFQPNNCPSLSVDNIGKISPKNESLPQPVVETNTPTPSQNPTPTTSSSPDKPDKVNPPSQPVTVENKPTPSASNINESKIPTVTPKPETTPPPESNPTPPSSNTDTNVPANPPTKPEVNDSSSTDQVKIEN